MSLASPGNLPPISAGAGLLPRRSGSTHGSPSSAVPRPDSGAATSGTSLSSTAMAWPAAPKRGRRLSKREQLMVVTQLSIMLRSGVDLAEAVRSIALRSASETTRSAMSSVYSGLESGRMLSQTLADQREQFGGVMVASVAAGEASGRLSEVLTRLSVIIRDELRLKSAIRSAVSYPIVLSLVTALVLTAMVFFVLPQFASIYEASRAPTPAVTKLLLEAAEQARAYWWLLLGSFLGGVFALLRYLKSSSGRRALDRALLRLPLLRGITTSLVSGRMFRLQGAMLDSGVPMLEVLQLTQHAVGNSCFAEMIDEIRESIINGEGMAPALRASACMPDEAAEMIGTAEANGQLGSVLQTVGEFYESEGEQQLRDAVKIAEPAIIVVLGLLVGVIVLAVMLPLLDLSTAGAM